MQGGPGAREDAPPEWRALAKRLAPVVVAGVTIYLVLPSVIHVLSSWPRLSTLNPIWFAVAVAAEAAHFTCTFALQRLALRTKGWFAVVTSELTGNAITNIMPGADAAGAAIQFRMLAIAGIDADTAVSGLTAFSLIEIGGLLALPIFLLPAILAGSPSSRSLVNTALVGAAGFVLFACFSFVFLRTDRPLELLGRSVQWLWNRVRRHRPLTGFPERLLRDRNSIRSALGASWQRAVLLCTARLGFDFGCLLAVLWATGSHPRPSLVLLAYAVTGVIGLLPITPGGLGIVEASLSGMLVVAGIGAGDALLATLAYRVVSYWLPLLAGLPAYLLFRRRYRFASATAAVPRH
ncbi:MAG: lysylphosphatidylglycerol synthase transmembrane domain-containing protein [Acidimicrobiales bacterium]